MHAARGILTTRGGMTSHAAVVARGMGRPCVAGAGSISVDYGAQTLSAASITCAVRRRILSRSITQTFLPWYRSVSASKSTC